MFKTSKIHCREWQLLVYRESPVKTFLSLFSKNIKETYTCYDRVILRGYILWMFSAGSLINFLRSMRFVKYTNGVMRVFTDQLNAHIEKTAAKLGIPIIWWRSVDGGKNGNKLRYVEKKFAKKSTKKGDFVYCILADMESTLSYSTRELTDKKGRPYDKMYKCNKIVKHYYIYFHDRLLGGPCYLKLSTYFPFHAEFYFNGHNAIRLAMDKKSLGYHKNENAFTMLGDAKAVQKLAWSLGGKHVQERIDYWMARWFRFDKGTYSTRPTALQHKWYCSQVEVCTNMIFKSARFCTRLFERLLDKYSRIGSPDSLSQIFGKRRVRKSSKSTKRLFENKACMKYWFGRNSIKFYNKLGYFLRIETTINDPKSLGLKKPVIHLREYLMRGEKNNRRLQNCFADVDLASIPDDEMEKLNRPVEAENGQKIAAPDLRKERQLALLMCLLNPKFSVHGFRTSDLLKLLGKNFRNLSQIRYELRKLIERGFVEKVKGQSFYMVTESGYKVLWVKCVSNSCFAEPMISATYKQTAEQLLSEPSKLETAYQQLNNNLSLIAKELCLKTAA